MRNHDIIKDQIDQLARVLKEMLGLLAPQNPAADYHQVVTKADETMKDYLDVSLQDFVKADDKTLAQLIGRNNLSLDSLNLMVNFLTSINTRGNSVSELKSEDLLNTAWRLNNYISEHYHVVYFDRVNS